MIFHTVQFSQNWFKDLQGLSNFNSLCNVIDLNKEIKYLEVGVFEGNAHLHMFNSVFKNNLSTSIALDPWGNGTGNSQHADVYELFKKNLNPFLDRIDIRRGYSDNILPELENKNYSFDIIYIDGDHTSQAVYKDAKNSWNLLKSGGILIFDDYLWHGFRNENSGILPDMAIGEIYHPSVGINNFLNEYKDKYRLLTKNDGLERDCKLLDLSPEKLKNYKGCDIVITHNYQILLKKL